MEQKTYLSSAQSGIYRATVPIPHDQRENLRKLVRTAGARSFIDLIQVIVQSPEAAGQALEPVFNALVGEERKRAALEKLWVTAARDGLTLEDLQAAFLEPGLP